MKYSIIINAAREAKTIALALNSLINPQVSGLIEQDFELITVIPDKETIVAANEFITKNFPKIKWIQIQDPYKGKPFALNLAFKKASGDILILTDGDVVLDKGAVGELVTFLKNNPEFGGVTGRPLALDQKNTFWGYIGNLLADAAHHKRIASMKREIGGKTLNLIKKGPGFFALSGYVMAIKNLSYEIPSDILSDDAYLTYLLVNKGFQLGYAPTATVKVKFPTNIKDWYSQKTRSVGGYIQLHKYNVVKSGKKVRNFWAELEYFWFPIAYAKNIKQFFWSLMLYPLRLFMWLRIYWERKIQKKDFSQTWVRIESTK